MIGQNSCFRGKFDFAMARAVGGISEVSEYLIPLLKFSGNTLIYKATWNDSEELKLNKILPLLNAELKSIIFNELPFNFGKRTIIKISPKAKCPDKYPRRQGIPKKRPLDI